MWPEGHAPRRWIISSLDVPGQKAKRNYAKWGHETLQGDGAARAHALKEGKTEGFLSKEVACCFLGLLCLMDVCVFF